MKTQLGRRYSPVGDWRSLRNQNNYGVIYERKN